MLTLGLIVAACLFAPLALNAALNGLTFGRLPRVADEPGRVSLLVPARDEAKRIGPLLESFLALDDAAALELIVYDDDSRDGTGELVAGYAARDARIRLVRGGPLPAGWGGKVHALHRLSEEARGDHLLFLDADVTLERGVVSSLLAAMRAGRLDVLSLYPRQVLGSWAEAVFVPVMVYYFYLFGSQWLMRLGKTPPVAALNGQAMCWRREAYDAIGGFASIRGAWIDDMAIAQRAVAQGLAIAYRPGVGLACCRMYTSFAEAWAGFAKHSWDAFSQPAPVYLGIQTYLLAVGVLPFWAVAAVAAWRPLSSAEWAAFGAYAALVAFTRVLACVQGGGGWVSALTHPFSLGGAVLNGYHSYQLARTRTSAWRGRTRAELGAE